MGIITKVAFTLGLVSTGLLAYSYADTQDQLIKLNNESRSLSRLDVEEYNTTIASGRQKCRAEFDACESAIDLSKSDFRNPDDVTKKADEFNACQTQRENCAGRLYDTLGNLSKIQWQEKRNLYHALICSPSFLTKVGLALDEVINIKDEQSLVGSWHNRRKLHNLYCNSYVAFTSVDVL